ncbi:hypothetical protein J2Z21_009384 [Streptomyces griseochromogenes]|nr:hypothetical protein [Streptomyces griseochromogenes]MBP2056366.1 hypothetical protein [Streptomyces griseochromogenes]
MGARAFAWTVLGVFTLWLACEIIANEAGGREPVVRAAVCLFALVVWLPLIRSSGVGESDQPGWYFSRRRRCRWG